MRYAVGNPQIGYMKIYNFLGSLRFFAPFAVIGNTIVVKKTLDGDK